jgi:hypothetical protein
MKVDEDKIDEVALALFYLSIHDECKAWKQVDLQVTNRFFEKG